MAECVVFAHNQGAASHWGDMCLPPKFKFDSVDELGDRVREVLSWDSFMSNYDCQWGYRAWVRDHERNFRDEVWELLAWAGVA